jgi:Immune inhibitor A-like, MAM domain
MRKALSGALALAGLAAMLVLPSSGLAGKQASRAATNGVDVKHAGSAVERGILPLDTRNTSALKQNTFLGKLRRAAADPVVGTQKTFLILDDFFGTYRLATFTLRAIGGHGEVWVQNNLSFPAGDCRNSAPAPDRINVTTEQANYLLGQFNDNIWPKEAEAFTIAPPRDGTGAILPGLVGLPADYYAGDGNKTVILVSNVRDDNYYDTNNAHSLSYIAGFFSGQLNDFFGRNVMTVDSYDWVHRTTANPPGDQTTVDLCAPVRPRPFLYEGTFAHEYQHLLEHYSDPDEVNWVNEGLSDWAMLLTGYAHPEIQAPTLGFDSHIQTFQGAFPPDQFGRHGGPENSLTRWQDQGPAEILADYGAAFSMMTYLDDHYGDAFMSALHKAPANGLAGLDDTLAAAGASKTSAVQTVNTWAVMEATDGLIDGGARILGPYGESTYSSTHLSSTINWSNPDAYDSPGAPPNGSDYVRLRAANGSFLDGRDIDSLSFSGSTTLLPRPVAWTSVTNAPAHAGDAALYSGFGNNRDEAIVKPVTVNGGTLTFDALWNEELGWDFGFVQVSTDGGATYSSLACTDTTTQTNPEALPTAKQNVPGFTGYPGGWKAESCSLAGYSGQVLLSFRTLNDPATLGASAAVPPGFWVDNVRIGSTLISDGSDIASWKSPTQINPGSVADFVVTIMSVNGNKITLKQLPLTGDFAVRNKANVQKYIDKNADLVAAIVTHDDPSETADRYAPYQLTVNGVVQPGGA